MFEKKIGFIGCGNMARSIIIALVNNGQIAPENIWVYDRKIDTNQTMARKYGVTPAENVESLAREVGILFGAVQPNIILKVLQNLASQLKKDALVVSIATGVTLDLLASVLGHDRKIIRVIPNTPSLVNEGMASVTPNALVEQKEVDEVMEIFKSFGKATIISEHLLHAVVSVSGSAPAYVFMFIEAMADAAVLGGMQRAQAYQFAAQAVKGSAQMVLETNRHPSALKDMVCSPGGTTIEAVTVLEEQGFRAAVIKAMQQCMVKSKTLSNQQLLMNK